MAPAQEAEKRGIKSPPREAGWPGAMPGEQKGATMPKEIITELATEVEGGGTAQFSIHWESGAGGEIQLGVTLDRASLAEYMAGLDDSETTVQWYSRPLRRPQVQRLIRAARRARDAVFGADE